MKRTPQEQSFNKRTASLYHSQKRRALPDFTLDGFRQALRVKLNKNPFCIYCKKMLSEMNVSVDHLQPLSLGGQHTLANIQFICAGCNKSKGGLTNAEYCGLLESLDVLERKMRNFSLKEAVLTSLRVANSFRIGANRRGKK